MLRVKSEKSDWFWSQSIVFTNPFKTGMSLDLFLVLTKKSAASGDENAAETPSCNGYLRDRRSGGGVRTEESGQEGEVRM